MESTEEYSAAITDAYWGEVYGIVLYGEIAASRSEPRERAVWETLTELEVAMEARLRPVFERLGGDSTVGIEEHRERGRTDGALYGALDWTSLMNRLSHQLDIDIALYGAIEDICPSDDAGVCRHLTAHEEVAKSFADAELAGHIDTSIDEVSALIAELRTS